MIITGSQLKRREQGRSHRARWNIKSLTQREVVEVTRFTVLVILMVKSHY
jgi:hypothetical protein